MQSTSLMMTTELSPAAQAIYAEAIEQAECPSDAKFIVIKALCAASLYCKQDRIQLLAIASELYTHS